MNSKPNQQKIYSQSPIQQIYHHSQTKTLNDKLIIVTQKDQVIGVVDKKTCHQNSYIFGDGYPHRAFSLFLFNKNNQLLMHRRSSLKIAFPQCWTNSCCSHPAVIEKQNDTFVMEQVKTSVIKRTIFELGIKLQNNPIYFVDKILYKSNYNEEWGEYQMDYVFICQLSEDITFQVNKEEIMEYTWVKSGDMQHFIERRQKEGQSFSPWFLKIYKSKLMNWWSYIDDNKISELSNISVNDINIL